MRRKFEGFRKEAAAIRLQKSIKGWLHRKAFLEKKKAASVLQAAARGMAARKSTRELRVSRAALVIQVHPSLSHLYSYPAGRRVMVANGGWVE